MRPGQSLSKLTARLLVKLENHFKHHRPDLVLAHGDTTTCFATALSSFYQQIPFFHVEAGLRSYHLNSPFPEEFNRQSVAPMAHHHFAPTELEKINLINDGIQDHKITVTGSTVHDAIHIIKTKNRNADHIPDIGTRPTVVVTLHRREANQAMQQTLTGLKHVAIERPDVMFICPIHPNPNVQNAFRSILGGHENIKLLDPLPYAEFISLLMKSNLVVTDSGGVQEESVYFGKRVLLARAETERRDGLDSGLVQLIGHDVEFTRRSIKQALCNSNFTHELLGENGMPLHASETIARVVERNIV